MSYLAKTIERIRSAQVTTGTSDPVADFLDGLSQRDVAAALAAVSDSVRVTVHGLSVRGETADSLRQVLDDIIGAFPDLRVKTKRVLRAGDVVTVELKVEGTQAQPYAGAINQEKHLDLDEAWRFEVSDGVIVAVDAYWCQQQLYRRLGVKRFDQIAIV